jgi:hypothetical protein
MTIMIIKQLGYRFSYPLRAVVQCSIPIVAVLGITSAAACPDAAAAVAHYRADWQYSVRLKPQKYRRAYLWIPPTCRHVRGVILGMQNMLERPFMLDSTIRRTCSREHLAEIWIAPGESTAGRQAPDMLFKRPKKDFVAIEKIFSRLARTSGYGEIRFAPILVVGHSAAAPFVWGMASKFPQRVFAAIMYKGYYLDRPENVPFLDVTAEWSEWGRHWGGNTLAFGRRSIIAMRLGHPDSLVGEFNDVGTGHFDFDHASTPILAMFIRQAVAARLPAHAPKDALVRLKTVNPDSGWLVKPRTLGKANFTVGPAAGWKGNPTKDYWYLTRKLAYAINQYMASGYAKKPQAIDFTSNGKPCSLKANGFAVLHPHFLPDGATFKVHAMWLSRSPSRYLFHDARHLGHAPGPILFRTIPSGCLQQTGPAEFRVALHAGGFRRLGPPWEPWILAYNRGNEAYRGTDRPARVMISLLNTRGKRQVIHFAQIKLRRERRAIILHATSSAGLPIQFYVVSGPVYLIGNRLVLCRIPPRSRYPLRVIIGAYQWGRATHPRVQSAGPVFRSFMIMGRQ